MKKFKYVDVKNYIESFGYKLVSKDYVSSITKLDLICLDGHSFEMNYDCFKRGTRCPVCARKKLTEKIKLSYDHVKNYIESFEYKLISKNYYNNREKIEIECSSGHLYKVVYGSFKNGHRCPICTRKINSDKRKLTYICVKNYIESFDGYQLISNKCNGNKDKLHIICPKGHLFKMNFNNFKQGNRCGTCNKEKIISRGEKEIANYIKSIYSGAIIENDRNQIFNPKTGKMLELDIWLPELNKAIEYGSNWWHKNRRYTDNQKQVQCNEKGIDLLVIEDEIWRKNKDYNLINNFIGEI